jgi:GST-like protein
MEIITKEARMAVRNPSFLQLYSANTPNGIKVAACLEEIIDLRATKEGFNYEAHTINLRSGETRTEDFLKINPNGKVPAIVDPNVHDNGKPIVVFESGAILIYLAEKYDELLPKENIYFRTETFKWMMWGSAAVSSQFKLFGFYFKYCPHHLPYCVQRYAKECNRLLTVLECQLKSHGKHWVIGECYTIADLAIWPWVYGLIENYDNAYSAVFEGLKDYPFVKIWYQRCLARPASQRSLDVARLMF